MMQNLIQQDCSAYQHCTNQLCHQQIAGYYGNCLLMCSYYILRSIMTDRRSYLTYEERRCRFLCFASIYFISWIVIGFVFLTVYLKQNQSQSLFLMIFFLVYGLTELVITIVLYNKTTFPWYNDLIVVGGMGPRYPIATPMAQPYGYPPQNTYNIYNNNYQPNQPNQPYSNAYPQGQYYPQGKPQFQTNNQMIHPFQMIAGRNDGL